MFKFFVNTKIHNICECTHIVPTFLQCDAMICKGRFANKFMYQWFTKFLICMDLQIYGKKWCDYLHQKDLIIDQVFFCYFRASYCMIFVMPLRKY